MKFPDELIFFKNSKLPQNSTKTRLDGKVCVISGATSGVGLAALKALASAGASCVIVARNVIKATKIKETFEDTLSANISIETAVFSSLSSVKSCAERISGKYPVIDILINSAGMHSTKRNITQDGNEEVFQVNHLSSFLFTNLLLDNVKSSYQGRIIQVNSQGHRFGGLNINDLIWKKRLYSGMRSYGASKIAQLICVMEMAKKLSNTNVTINAMHPGAVKSQIGSNNGKLYRLYNKYLVQPSLDDPEVAGNAIYWLAADPSLQNTTGKFFNLTIEEPPASYVINRKYYDKVYPLSLRLCGLE